MVIKQLMKTRFLEKGVWEQDREDRGCIWGVWPVRHVMYLVVWI